MKKTVISVAIMVTVGTGLIFGTRAVTPQQKIEAAPTAVEQAEISELDVEMKMESSRSLYLRDTFLQAFRTCRKRVSAVLR